jgi:hypothetical protein
MTPPEMPPFAAVAKLQFVIHNVVSVADYFLSVLI